MRNLEGELLAISSIGREITERKRFESQLQWLADHDPLTELLNRRRFVEELSQAVAGQRQRRPARC